MERTISLEGQKYELLAYPILMALFILSLSFHPLNNIALASGPSALINPFIASKDLCGDGKDNDGNGYVDDDCGTISLKIMNNMSGAITNVSSICHEDCHLDGED